jgi:MFS family permease
MSTRRWAGTAVGAPGADAEANPPGRWVSLGLLGFAVLLAMAPWLSAAAVLPQLRAEWSLTTTQGSLLTIAVQVGFVAGAVTSAALSLADVVPPRRLILIGSLGAALANAGLVVVGSVGPALALRFATGMFLAAVYPPALKSMATWFRRGRGLALGILVGALTLGSAGPHLVNGLGGLEWTTVIVVTSALTAAGGLLAELAGRDGPYPFPRASFDPRAATRVMRDRAVRLASVGYFGHMWELYAMWAWFAVYYGDVLTNAGVVDQRRSVGFATVAVFAAGAVGCVVGGVLGDRWGRTRTATLSLACSGSAAVVAGLLHDRGPLLVLGVALFWGFWVVADSAQFSTIVTEVADQHHVGTALTVQLAVGFTLTVATIWLVPLIRDGHGWAWAFAVLAPGPVVGAIAMVALARSPAAARIAGGRG